MNWQMNKLINVLIWVCFSALFNTFLYWGSITSSSIDGCVLFLTKETKFLKCWIFPNTFTKSMNLSKNVLFGTFQHTSFTKNCSGTISSSGVDGFAMFFCFFLYHILNDLNQALYDKWRSKNRVWIWARFFNTFRSLPTNYWVSMTSFSVFSQMLNFPNTCMI